MAHGTTKTHFTTKEVSELVGRSPQSIRRYISAGLLKACDAKKLGKYPTQQKYLITRKDALDLKTRIEQGDPAFTYGKPAGNGKVLGEDYTYIYLPCSEHEASAIRDIITGENRVGILKTFATKLKAHPDRKQQIINSALHYLANL